MCLVCTMGECTVTVSLDLFSLSHWFSGILNKIVINKILEVLVDK